MEFIGNIVVIVFLVILVIVIPSMFLGLIFNNTLLQDSDWRCTKSELRGEQHKQESFCIQYSYKAGGNDN